MEAGNTIITSLHLAGEGVVDNQAPHALGNVHVVVTETVAGLEDAVQVDDPVLDLVVTSSPPATHITSSSRMDCKLKAAWDTSSQT